jgi:hypothetical protein
MKKITFLFITVFLIIASTVIIVAQPQFESTTIKELSRIKISYNNWNIRTYCVDGYKFVHIFFDDKNYFSGSAGLTQVFKNDNGKSVPESCK